MSKPSAPTIERRFIQEGIELREQGEGKMPVIAGYAARFNTKSVVMWGFREVIKPGAFAQSLGRGDDVRVLVNHDSANVIGRRSAGTLKVLEEDGKGLRFEVEPPDTQAGRDIVTSIRRKDVTGMSFGFRTVKANWTIDANEGNIDIRELLQVDLIEVSPVTFPAYPDTEVSVRSWYDQERREAREGRPASDIDIRRLDARLRLAEVG